MAVPLLIAILVLLAGSAYFSGTEAALFSLTRLQLRRLEERRDRGSRRIRRLLRQPNQTLATLLVGNNLVNIALSAIVTVLFLEIIQDRARAVEVSFVVATLAVLLIGEITAKTLAVNFALPVARGVSGSFLLVSYVLRPVTKAFHWLAVQVLRALGVERPLPAARSLISRAELRSVLEDVDEESAVITPSESRLVQNILEFPERTAEQIMTPRVDVVDLPIDAAPDEARRIMRTTRHSRYPVYEGEPDNVVGFVRAKDSFLNSDKPLRELLRPVAFFPEVATVERVFYELQRSHTSAMVIVVNEFGEMVGLITREDGIEEIVGDIYDEFDLEETPIREKGEGRFILPGRISLQDLNEALELDLPDESAVTLNGFLCEVYGRIPRPGAVIAWRELRFHVLETARHRIHRVLLERPQPSDREAR